MRIVTVVGARPQFIKAAPVSRALRRRYTEVLVHTGQHYDEALSAVFFAELELPRPDYNLGVGSGTHAAQTAAMLTGVAQILEAEQPDWVLVYGDTNSTLAGALAAAKLHVPVAHVEAGLRSYNRRMPEEINRVLTDHISDLLFCPSQTAVDHLATEGIMSGVHLVGDVMIDALAYAATHAQTSSDILQRLELTEKGFLLATVHRAENTDDQARLCNILGAFTALDEPVIFPVHPRTRTRISSLARDFPSGAPSLRLVEPIGYLDMVRLEQAARLILTDSGGVQKEAYWLGVPCITLRGETEWVETVRAGWNTLVGADRERIVATVRDFRPPSSRPPLYGDGKAAERIADFLGTR